MENRDEIKKRIRAGEFIDNNGTVLRAINVLRHEYHKITGLPYALLSLQEDEILDSVNYLWEAGYIHLRDCETKELVLYGMADIRDYRRLEAKLTAKGISLLAYTIRDDSVRV